jgi:hypothetical protein
LASYSYRLGDLQKPFAALKKAARRNNTTPPVFSAFYTPRRLRLAIKAELTKGTGLGFLNSMRFPQSGQMNTFPAPIAIIWRGGLCCKHCGLFEFFRLFIA